MLIENVFELVIVFMKGERMTQGMCDVWKRESWAGRIATRVCEMARLSRADSLVGGHLDINENVKEKERNCENCEVWVILRLIDVNCGELSLIELWDNDLID